MLKKFQELEELQAKLRGFCPPAQLDNYKCGKPIFLAKIHHQLLNPEYLDDVKRVLERQRNVHLGAAAGAAVRAADGEAAFNDDFIPDYDQLRQEVLATWRSFTQRSSTTMKSTCHDNNVPRKRHQEQPSVLLM